MKRVNVADTWYESFRLLRVFIARLSHSLLGVDRKNPHLNQLLTLETEISEIELILETLRKQTTGLASLHKFGNGLLVTKEDFLLLVLTGIIRSDLVEQAYFKFTHFFYQDDTKSGYIDPKMPIPSDTELRGERLLNCRLGNEIRPEEVQKKYLRKEQTIYFQKEYPELFERFKKTEN